MYEVATREKPERSLLCLKRNVDEQGQWAFGKEFIAIMRERPLPKIEGRAGATFCIQWGWVNADSDGPVEWCTPVPQAEAHALAEHYPELTLRTEPAHGEVFVALPARYGLVQWQLAMESMQAWEQEHEDEDEDDLAALAVLSVAAGTLLRHPAAGIAAMMAVVLVLPLIAQALPNSWRNPVTEFWPTQAGSQLTSVYHSAHTLQPWPGFGVMCLFVAIVYAIAWTLLDRRDA